MFTAGTQSKAKAAVALHPGAPGFGRGSLGALGAPVGRGPGFGRGSLAASSSSSSSSAAAAPAPKFLNGINERGTRKIILVNKNRKYIRNAINSNFMMYPPFPSNENSNDEEEENEEEENEDPCSDCPLAPKSPGTIIAERRMLREAEQAELIEAADGEEEEGANAAEASSGYGARRTAANAARDAHWFTLDGEEQIFINPDNNSSHVWTADGVGGWKYSRPATFNNKFSLALANDFKRIGGNRKTNTRRHRHRHRHRQVKKQTHKQTHKRKQ